MPVFEHPREVVAHPTLSLSEKRALLASWARFVLPVVSKVDADHAETTVLRT